MPNVIETATGLVGGVTAGIQVGRHLNLHHKLSKLRSVQQMCWTFLVKRHNEKLGFNGGLITLKESNNIPTF